MVFQCAGSLLAGFTAIWLRGTVVVAEPINIVNGQNDWLRAIVQEIVGTFCFAFFYLSQTEAKTVISEIETIQCLVLSASYIAARSIVCGNAYGAISTYGAMLNPSFAIGIQITSWFNNLGEALKFIWLYPVLPFAGSIAALFFFEFVYKKT